MKEKIIVSMTSYTKRINTVHISLQTILSQNVKPDKIILSLIEAEFPEKRLPEELELLIEHNKSILEVEYHAKDIKSHNKYYYVMQDYPEDIVITVDDDIIYDSDLLEKLIDAHKKFPDCVISRRCHTIPMTFDDKGAHCARYEDWEREEYIRMKPSDSSFATGVGGVLYPPGAIGKEAFDADIIEQKCLTNDDMWLKVQEMLNGTKVVNIGGSPLKYIEDTQSVGLWNRDNRYKELDRDWTLLMLYCKDKGLDAEKLLAQSYLEDVLPVCKEAKADLKAELKKTKKELKSQKKQNEKLRKSKSYRIGRAVTAIPRGIAKVVKTAEN